MTQVNNSQQVHMSQLQKIVLASKYPHKRRPYRFIAKIFKYIANYKASL